MPGAVGTLDTALTAAVCPGRCSAGMTGPCAWHCITAPSRMVRRRGRDRDIERPALLAITAAVVEDARPWAARRPVPGLGGRP